MYLRINIAGFIFLLFPYILFSQGKARKYLIEGNKNYVVQSYDEAAANYLRAIQEGGDSYKSNFNLGNAMYRQKKYSDAISQFEKSIKFASGKLEKSQAYFNAGNGYFKKKDYKKAAESFKKALKLNPRDDKARYNYAVTKEKLKEQEKQQQKNNNSDSNNQNENKDGEKDQNPDNSEDKKSQSLQENKEGQQGQSGGQGDNQSGQGVGNQEGREGIKNSNSREQENVSGSMQEQYYEGILGAMKEQERRAQQKIINKRIPPSGDSRGKDW